MIFVTVGSYPKGFDRLIKKMDEIAERIDEEIIMQIGHPTYKPANAKYLDFASYSKIQQFNADARIVVSHAGIGSILTALKHQKHIVIVPRLEKYGEFVKNDHQLQIAKELSKSPNITVIYDMKDLENALKLDYFFVENRAENMLVSSIKKYIFSINLN